ncbi:MAG: hypothetical protein ABS939_10335 [Psychrobacillus sp.]
MRNFEEFKKIKGLGAYPILISLILISVCFQGGLGLMAEIADYKYFVTTFGLFCRLFLGVAIGLLISLSFYSEYNRKGYLNVILNGQSFSRLLLNKLLFFYTFILVYLLFALSVSLGFQLFKGSELSSYYKEILMSFAYLFITAMLLVNIHMFLSMIFRQMPMISLLISILCSFLNLFISSTSFWIFFPWSYPVRILYLTSLDKMDFLIITLVTLISFGLISYYIFIYTKKKQYI